MISFDGGSNQLLHDYLKFLPKDKGFLRIQKEGYLADEGMTVCTPSLTAASHISTLTGAPPRDHGIVSNNFHILSDPIEKATNGFSAKLDPKTKTIWEKVRAQEKKVGVIAYPALDNTDDRRSADWSINFSKQAGASTVQTLTATHFEPYTSTLPASLKSFTPPKVASLILSDASISDSLTALPHHHLGPSDKKNKKNIEEKPPQYTFKVISIDTSDDKASNYDTLILDSDDDLANGYVGTITKTSPWIGIGFKDAKGTLKGSWCKLVQLTSHLETIKLYTGPIYATQAFPDTFQKTIDEKLGFWPGPPDKNSLDLGLTEEDLFTQGVRFSEYLKNVTILGAQTQAWDLILTYQPLLDELEHMFYMNNPQQKDFSPEKSKQYMDIIQRGYLEANKTIDELMTQFKNSHLVMVSDHGMAPLHHVYYPNRTLEVRGYIDQGSLDNENGKPKYLAKAFSSGGLSHIYINLTERHKSGIVPKTKYDQLVKEIVNVFKDEEAIAKVYTKEEAQKLELDHIHCGDIVLVAKPGYHLSDALDPGQMLEPASFYGQHGYDSDLPSMKAFHGVWGPKIKPKKVSGVSYKEIVPLVLSLLTDE